MRNLAFLVPTYSQLDELDDVCVEVGYFHQYTGLAVQVEIKLDARKDDCDAAQRFGNACNELLMVE